MSPFIEFHARISSFSIQTNDFTPHLLPLSLSLSLSLSLWLRNFNPIHDAFEQRENTGGQKQDAKFRRCLRIIEEDKIVIILSWKE